MTVSRWLPAAGLGLAGLTLGGTGPVIQPTPNPSGPVPTYLAGISCASKALCMAVGHDLTASGSDAPLAEEWNGATWAIEPVARPAKGTGSTLVSVSCPSTSSCFAIGQSTSTSGRQLPLIEHWDGTAWRAQQARVPSGVTGGSTLAGISCPGISSCVAVGYYAEPHSTHHLPLAEHWNGRRWWLETVPHPVRTTLRELEAVSCSSASSCFAVGRANGSTLIEHWNGRRWSTQPSANPRGNGPPTLQGVSCLSPSFCTAVGYHSAQSVEATMVEHWNGRHWRLQPTNVAFGAANLYFEAVACATESSCFAVGYGDGIGTLIEHWNGRTWSLTASPTATSGAELAAISCPTSSSCSALGEEEVSPSGQVALAERWSGRAWVVERSPNAAGPQSSKLLAVSCPSASECLAVGSYVEDPSGTYRTLAEIWNGQSWAILSTANPGRTEPAGGDFLQGVSCPSTTSCFAVGYYYGASGVTPLIEHWDGSGWVVQPSPSPVGAELRDVACPSASSCFAVGYAQGGSLVEQWAGASWTIQSSGASAKADLWAVSCTSVSSCVAVGNLAATWNGTTWKFGSYPNPYHDGSILVGVSCASSSSCFGVYGFEPGRPEYLEQWNGTRWSIASAPAPKGAQGTSLLGISCPSTSSCAAVGDYEAGTASAFTLVEKWDGKRWSPVSSPDPLGARSSYLEAVSCAPSTAIEQRRACTAVGFGESSRDATLALRL